MEFEIDMQPKPERTLRQFRASNPWSGGETVSWRLAGFRMVSGNPYRQYNKECLGIISEPDGRYHMFPAAVDSLWRAGRIPDTRLPDLLHSMEPGLRPRDYPAGSQRRVYAALAIFLGTIAAMLFGLYVWLGPEEKTALVSGREWLQNEWRTGDRVVLSDSIPFIGTVEVSRHVEPPPGYKAIMHQPQPFSVGIVKARNEHRLVLLDQRQARMLRYVMLYGVSLSAVEVALPRSLLDELRSTYPDLNTRTIYCQNWRKKDKLPGTRGGPEWLYAGLAAAAAAMLCQAVRHLAARRIMRQEQCVIEALAGAAGAPPQANLTELNWER